MNDPNEPEEWATYRRQNRHWRPSRPGRCCSPHGQKKRGNRRKFLPAKAEQIRKEYEEGHGARGGHGVRPARKGEGLPGTVRALAKKHKTSTGTIQRVLYRKGAYAVGLRPGEAAPTSAEQTKQKARAKRERALAIEAVKQYRAIGANGDAEALIRQFRISAAELEEA